MDGLLTSFVWTELNVWRIEQRGGMTSGLTQNGGLIHIPREHADDKSSQWQRACSQHTTLYANYCHDSYRRLNCLGFQALIRPCPHPQLQNPVYVLAGDRRRPKKKLISLVDGQWASIPSAGAWRATYNLSINEWTYLRAPLKPSSDCRP